MRAEEGGAFDVCAHVGPRQIVPRNIIIKQGATREQKTLCDKQGWQKMPRKSCVRGEKCARSYFEARFEKKDDGTMGDSFVSCMLL